MMNNNSINNDNYHLWVERFLNAETSIDEEKELCAYFSRHDIPQEARRYRDMFAWYRNLSATDISGSTLQTETPLRLLPLRPIHWVGIAAMLAILVTIGVMVNHHTQSTTTMRDGYIYEAYMIRDGKKIYDADLVESEIQRVRAEFDRGRAELQNRFDQRPHPHLEIETDNPAARDFIKTSFNF